MQALGLIETRGLIVAIESADAMLKAADVSLLEKTYVGGGLVTIAVTGDVGAVKAAVEAGAAAVRKLNNASLLSEHVIPRPHQELDDVIVSTAMLKQEESEMIPPIKADLDQETEIESEVEVETEVKAEAEPETDSIEVAESDLHKDIVDRIALESGVDLVLSALNKLKVVKLRNLAREYKDFGITGRMISKADKQMIITEFRQYYEQK